MSNNKTISRSKKEININIVEAFLRILSYEERIKKLSELNEVEDVYRYCIKFKGGYTFAEFIDFIEIVLKEVDFSKIDSQKMDKLVPLGNDDDDRVAGGVNEFKRILAGGLAATSLLAGTGSDRSFAAFDASVSDKIGTSASESTQFSTVNLTADEIAIKSGLENDENLKELFKNTDLEAMDERLREMPKEKRQETKSALTRLWNYVCTNKKKIFIGGLCITATVLLAIGCKLLIKEKIDNSKANELLKEVGNGTDAVQTIIEHTGGYNSTQKKIALSKLANKAKNNVAVQSGGTKIHGDSVNDAKNLEIAIDYIKNTKNGDTIKYSDKYNGFVSKIKTKVALDELIKDNTIDSSFVNAIKGTFSFLGPLIGFGSIVVAGISSAWDLVEKGLKLVSENLGRVKQVTDTVQSVAGMYERASYNAKVWADNVAAEQRTREEVMEDVKEKLGDIYGQDQQIKVVKEFVENFLRQEELSEATGGSRKPQAVLISGTSGCGKSLCCERVGQAVADPGCSLVINASTQLYGSAEDMKYQLFGKKRMSAFSMISSDAPEENLAEILANHPGARVVVTVNEIDKMVKDGRNCIGPFLEVMREILDNGYVTVHGKKIECQNVLWQLTANLSKKSLETSLTNRGDRVEQGSAADDLSGSLKDLKLDASILNRMKLIYFNDLTPEAFADLCKNRLQKSIDYFGSEEGGELSFEIAPDMFKKIGAYSVTRRSQGRLVDKLQDRFNNQVGELRDKIKNLGYSAKGVIVKCDFDDPGDATGDVSFKLSIKRKISNKGLSMGS